MTEQNQDEKLRGMFERLRELDEAAAPHFGATWRHAADRADGARTKNYFGWWTVSLGGAVGALTMIAVAMSFMTLSRRRDAAPSPATQASLVQPAVLDFLLPSAAPGRKALSALDFDSDPLAGVTRTVPRGLE